MSRFAELSLDLPLPALHGEPHGITPLQSSPVEDPLRVNAYPAACAIADHRLPFGERHKHRADEGADFSGIGPLFGSAGELCPQGTTVRTTRSEMRVLQ